MKFTFIDLDDDAGQCTHLVSYQRVQYRSDPAILLPWNLHIITACWSILRSNSTIRKPSLSCRCNHHLRPTSNDRVISVMPGVHLCEDHQFSPRMYPPFIASDSMCPSGAYRWTLFFKSGSSSHCCPSKCGHVPLRSSQRPNPSKWALPHANFDMQFQ